MISVLLPTYNAMPYLPEAVESIIAQRVGDWHLVIVDDGSTDGTAAYLRNVQRYLGSTMTVVTFPENRGVVEALNTGLDFCMGDFIARMDADDISLPTRFERQLAYLQYHNYDGCGSWIQFFGDEDRLMEFSEQPEEVRDFLFLRTTVAHPTYFFKRRIYEQFQYDPAYEYAEDVDFLLRATEHYRIGNVPRVLLKYRADYSRNRSCEDVEAQAESVKRARVEACKRRGLDPAFNL